MMPHMTVCAGIGIVVIQVIRMRVRQLRFNDGLILLFKTLCAVNVGMRHSPNSQKSNKKRNKQFHTADRYHLSRRGKSSQFSSICRSSPEKGGHGK